MKHITLAHGNGGRRMRELIDEVFARHLRNPELDTHCDAAALTLPSSTAELFYTTDGFTVQPLEFPGGDIGSLAVHGTVNDLAVAGATPLYLSLNAFIEEGLALSLLDRLVASLADAARACNVRVVAGDTKVVPRGQGGGLYLATTGIGIRAAKLALGMDRIRPGDRLVVSGSLGDHGVAVMLAREQFGLRGDIQSDAASVLPLTQAALDIPGVRFMRDPTRGGLATVLHEILRATGHGAHVLTERVPVSEPVQAVCEILGYDPWYLACEGRVMAVIAPESSAALVQRWRGLPQGRQAVDIGEIRSNSSRVVLETEFGGQRVLDELEDDPLPRIC